MSNKRKELDEIKKSVVNLKEVYEESYEELKNSYFQAAEARASNLGQNVFRILEDIIRLLEDKEKN